MSQPTSPGETQQTNPVGTQEVSPGEPAQPQQPEQPQANGLPPGATPLQPAPQQTPLQQASQDAHDDALNGKISQEQLSNAVAKAVSEQFQVTNGWQPKKEIKFVINCPSGQPALVRHLDTRHLLRANLLEEMDRFQKQLFPQSLDEQGNPVEKSEDEAQDGIWAILRDPEKRRKFFDMTNRLMVVASVQPKIVNDGVALRNNDSGELEEVFGYEVESIDEQIKLFGHPVPVLKDDEAYAGAIDFADRMAFFQELNKPLGLIEPFREESDAVLASMESEPGLELQTQ